jgi:ATP-binding cassette subfamily B protein
VESGAHAKLIELKGLYYAMWRQQIGEDHKPSSRVALLGARAMVTGN